MCTEKGVRVHVVLSLGSAPASPTKADSPARGCRKPSGQAGLYRRVRKSSGAGTCTVCHSWGGLCAGALQLPWVRGRSTLPGALYMYVVASLTGPELSLAHSLEMELDAQ